MSKPRLPSAPSLFAALATAAAVAMVSAILLGTPATARERDATAAEWRKVLATLRQQDYGSISDVDVVGDTFVADAISRSGADVDLILNRTTLRIIRERRS